MPREKSRRGRRNSRSPPRGPCSKGKTGAEIALTILARSPAKSQNLWQPNPQTQLPGNHGKGCTAWAFVDRFITGIFRRDGRPACNHVQVLAGIIWIAQSGAVEWSARGVRKIAPCLLPVRILDSRAPPELLFGYPEQERGDAGSDSDDRQPDHSGTPSGSGHKRGNRKRGVRPFKRCLHSENQPRRQRP